MNDIEEVLNEINQVFSSSDLRGTRESKIKVINFVKSLDNENERLKEQISTLKKDKELMKNCSNCGWGKFGYECIHTEKDPEKCGEWYLGGSK